MQVDEVIVTGKLSQRRWRTPDHAAEKRALLMLGKVLTGNSESLFQRLTEISLDLCQAGSAGLSLIAPDEKGGEIFRWVAVAGAYAPLKGGSTSRKRSPCGVCLARETPQLYERPERYFTELAEVQPPIVEGLVVPIICRGRPLGTIWIVSHSPERCFDREDVRIMESLVGFVSAAILRAESEQKLKSVENLNRKILLTTPDCVKVVDAEGRIIFMNDAGRRILGIKSKSSIKNKVWADFWDKKNAVLARAAVAQAARGRTNTFQAAQKDQKGRERWWDVTAARLPGADQHVLIISREISRQKESEIQLKEAQRELEAHARNLEARVLQRTDDLQGLNVQLQKLSRKLLKSQEEERCYIAKELHDELGQKLTGLKFLLEDGQNTPSSLTGQNLPRAQQLVASLIHQVRDLSFDLRQSLPDHINLKTALACHFSSLKQDQSLEVDFKCGSGMESIPLECRRTVYRVVQEALTNVVRHTRTRRAVVALRIRKGRLNLRVQDFGKGFDLKKCHPGEGIRGMRERVLLCGGAFTVKSSPRSGTCVESDIPLHLA